MTSLFRVLAIVKLTQVFASLHVTYNITNESYGTDIYKCARYVTSNAYIGARYKLRRHRVCEPLYFSSFAASDLDNDNVYLIKTCVQEYFPKKRLGNVSWPTPVVLEPGTKITVKFAVLSTIHEEPLEQVSFNLWNIENERYIFHMKVHHAHMSSVIFNIKDGISPWGKEINKPLRNPIQVGTEYILHLDIQNTFIKTYIDDEFIHDFQYGIPLSEGVMFDVYERSYTVPLVQTMYIEMCK